MEFQALEARPPALAQRPVAESLQLGSGGHQGPALFVVGEKREVLYEALGQVHRFSLPLTRIGVGIARIEYAAVHVVQGPGYDQVEYG